MLRTITRFAAAAATALVVVPATALADAPTRTPIGNTSVTGSCPGFDVTIDVAADNETFTAFSDGRGLITGTYKATITNTSTGEAITVNASGPVFLPAEGGITLRGASLIFGPPAELAFGEPSVRLVLGVIRFVDTDQGTTVTVQGSVRDICAELA